ncbi:SusC/RagA family TonB-linked outer membrane protein [Persicitalea jodogahamensis]|uniref:SusC/RagA family TonB-linked outer membrane protein n=1 Tax=Persicitalea jodogahamensis TaxID=402147 RepID=A0A8J3GB09_9BACT|nr:SusC/RagA family TonB-linked outer membrane protein [Persicitalea jodogahamensis]GHB77913.1 SusC/RagA family TonB-linked outer membrane protein [Persicitalea jodogahamensis]
MRKFFALFLGGLLFLGSQAIAQDRTVSGKVTAEDGSVLPGVNISIKGTTRGTNTNGEGTYSISAPANSTLIFSFIGFKNTEVPVGNQSTINVSLTTDVNQLNEVVVTALGISRDKKALGYSVQEVKGENLTVARDQNVGNALAGKVAGVQVLGQSGAKFGTPNIRIRGINSLTGNDPLYVVDGTPTDISQVNMDDVESLTVLKGPSATALYGNRASAGVIVVTTKRAKAGETSLTVNHSSTLDMVALLPKYQNEYGGGYSQDFETFQYDARIHPADWQAFNGQRILDYSADESWGPKLDGQPHRSAASWLPGPQFGQLTPYEAHPNNVRDFFEKPVSSNTNFAFARGGEFYNSRISYTHIINNGIVPNSSQTKDYISAKNSISFSKRLIADLNINYTATKSNNIPADRYGSSGGTGTSNSLFGVTNATLSGYNQTVGSFNQWFQRQLSIEDLRNYKNEDGSYRSWNIGGPLDAKPKYWDSPYTQVYDNTNLARQQRLFGDIGLTYNILDNLTATAKVRRDYGSYVNEGRIAYGTLNAGGKGAYAFLTGLSLENNYEGLLSYNRDFAKISLVANGGGNIRYNRTEGSFQSTVGGLASPGFYNIAASNDRPISNNYLFERRVNSLFANVSLGYDNILFIEGSVRNDWSSTLPKANNSYLYPSVSASFVFSEFIPQNNILSFGKLRGGYAQVGTDVGPYQTALTYTVGTVYGANSTTFLPNLLPNTNLKPGLSSSYEGGVDLKFFNNALSLEFTAYQNNNKNQIIPLAVSPESGYTNAYVNAGLIKTSGLELHLGATPISNKNFTWQLDLNADRNKSQVVELAEGQQNYQIDGPQWRSLTLNARVGQPWGILEGQGIKKDANGNNVVYSPTAENIEAGLAGMYVKENNVKLGSVLPKFKGGLLNTFTYRDFTLRVNTDFVVGGKFFSVTRMFNAYSGLSAETAGLNELGNPKRDDPANGGGIILDAVTQDGQPNTYRVNTQDLYEGQLFALNENWIYDKTYAKLREVSFGYNFPSRVLGRFIKTANVSLIGRNLLLIYSAVGGGIDISETETLWYEGGQLPPVRSMGVNVRLGF